MARVLLRSAPLRYWRVQRKLRILPAQLVRMQQVERAQYAKTSAGSMFLVAGLGTAIRYAIYDNMLFSPLIRAIAISA